MLLKKDGGWSELKSLRGELFEKLIQKTKELGRRVSFSEMRDDPSMPDPNQFAFYYGSFANAAERAFSEYVSAEKNTKNGGDVTMSKRKRNPLSEELTKQIVSEIVDMYIAADGKMPGKREIKKNAYISEKQVMILRQAGELNELTIRKLAEEKTGKKFLSSGDRQKQDAILARQKRLALIEELDAKAKPCTEEVKQTEPEEAEKMNEKERKPYKNWTAEKITDALKNYYDTEGRLPKDKELRQGLDNLPSIMTIKRYLGHTREDWLRAIGVEVPETARAPETVKVSGTVDKVQPVGANDAAVLEDIADLIGPDGMLKQLGDVSGSMAELKIEKHFTVRFGKIIATVVVSAELEK